MSSTLSVATQDRKARLAQLKSLKRKQPDTYQETEDPTSLDDQPPQKSPRHSPPPAPPPSTYISGRNYDTSTRGPKLGFESAPSSNQTTLEKRAADLAAETKAQSTKDAEEDKPLDLFKLQPKKPNWDLKRDLDRKLEVLNVRTENAIARLVRERIAGAQGRAKVQNHVEQQGNTNGGERSGEGRDGEEVGMDGAVLVEATKEREREDEEDARRERELDEELLDAS